MSKTPLPITIRLEADGDKATIHALTTAAFEPMPFSDGSEPGLVDQLRDDGDLTLSMVAESAGRIVGHIAFSPVTIEDGASDWYGLGPVSVWPDLQHQGVGGALIRRGIADLTAHGARGFILLGSPVYYSRFGFRHEPQLTYPGPPPEFFQALLIQGDLPQGKVSYAPAFG